jgi:hypothetical protein
MDRTNLPALFGCGLGLAVMLVVEPIRFRLDPPWGTV